MSLKLLKFDTVNPENYLNLKIKENLDIILKMDRQEFLDWIISLRANFSDFYTYNLRKAGWEAEEFFVTPYYIDKVADEIFGNRKKFMKIKEKIKNKIRPVKKRWLLNVVREYIDVYKPDVILVREVVGIPSSFWRSYSDKILLVDRMATPVPREWSVNDWHLILTSTNTFKDFFELNGVDSYINPNGFDERIIDEIKDCRKEYEVTFVGGLGDRFWARRTKCINFIADKVNFSWWGLCGNKYPADHPIIRTNKGITSGLEMLKIYKKSKIVFNDYGEIANGSGVNQRMFEVLGSGAFLLTRHADNLKKDFPDNIFVTFSDDNDCLEKIRYYLKNEKEREEIAAAGQKYILENYNYKNLMTELDHVIKQSYKKFFPDRKQQQI